MMIILKGLSIDLETIIQSKKETSEPYSVIVTRKGSEMSRDLLNQVAKLSEEFELFENNFTYNEASVNNLVDRMTERVSYELQRVFTLCQFDETPIVFKTFNPQSFNQRTGETNDELKFPVNEDVPHLPASKFHDEISFDDDETIRDLQDF